jgi:hypothetical protein
MHLTSRRLKRHHSQKAHRNNPAVGEGKNSSDYQAVSIKLHASDDDTVQSAPQGYPPLSATFFGELRIPGNRSMEQIEKTNVRDEH